MAQINLITTTRKYIDYTEANINFLRRYQQEYLELSSKRKKARILTSPWSTKRSLRSLAN